MNDLPSRHAPETSRRLGLLFAVGVLTLASRWLQPADAETATEAPPAPASQIAQDPVPPDRAPLRLTEVTQVEVQSRRPARLGPPAERDAERAPAGASQARPISAALCHALDERMKALDSHAAGKLPRHELRKLRAERQRARDLQQGLRCRAGGDRYWF